MAKINITDGSKLWSLCSDCKRAEGADTITEIVENAKHHLATDHAYSTHTHRIEMNVEHLVALTNAAHLAGEADGEV